MNEDTDFDPEVIEVDELALLKQRADIMGIKYHPNIKLDSLKAKINAKIDGETEDYSDEEIESAEASEAAMREETSTPLAKPTFAQLAARRKQDALRLVRIRIACMNPVKTNMKGEIFCVGNAELGMLKKYVPFNAEQGWHVPNLILQEIRDKKFVTHYDTKVGNKTITRTKLVPEYSVEILDPLTAEELKDLANRQLMSNK